MVGIYSHFPLKTAMSGVNFMIFSTRIFPPSRSSLLQKKQVRGTSHHYLSSPEWKQSCHLWYLERSLLPGVALATIFVKPMPYFSGKLSSSMWFNSFSVNPDRKRHFPETYICRFSTISYVLMYTLYIHIKDTMNSSVLTKMISWSREPSSNECRHQPRINSNLDH